MEDKNIFNHKLEFHREIGRIGRHRAETHRHFNIRFFGPMPPDASDFPGGIPAIDGRLLLLLMSDVGTRTGGELLEV